jgi:hypothetical protein
MSNDWIYFIIAITAISVLIILLIRGDDGRTIEDVVYADAKRKVKEYEDTR